MIKALILDSLNRSKWLAVAYLFLVSAHSWGKYSVFVMTDPIPRSGWPWEDSILGGIVILGLAIAGLLVPYDQLTDRDAFWATRTARLIHILTANTISLSIIIVLPLVISESLLSLLWGSISTTLSVALQSALFPLFSVFIVQILLASSRNPFKTTGIAAICGVVGLATATNFHSLRLTLDSEYFNLITQSLYVFTMIAATITCFVCIRRKIEWPHIAAAIYIPLLLSSQALIREDRTDDLLTSIKVPELPSQASAAITIVPRKSGGTNYQMNAMIDIGEVRANSYLRPEGSLVTISRATPLRMNLNTPSTPLGMRVIKDQDGGLKVYQNSTIALTSKHKLVETFREKPATSLQTLWLEFELADQKCLTENPDETYEANGIITRLVKTQYLPATEETSPPEPAIFQAQVRQLNQYPYFTPHTKRTKETLPDLQSIQRIYYIEYGDGSSRFTTTGQRSANDDTLMPIHWSVTTSNQRIRDPTKKTEMASAIYALDFRLIKIWKSELPLSSN